MSLSFIPRPLVIIILDGWGLSSVASGNAIAAAHTPTMQTFAEQYPSASLSASGIEVGLPWGEVGNSETGHSNIGAGQVQYQALPRIDHEIETGAFMKNQVLRQAMEHATAHNSNLHFMGLVSPGGVHAHQRHLIALLRLAAEHNFRDRVYVHMFTDGRDTPPQSALSSLALLEEAIGKWGVGQIASVTGRFYAMDRNNNWERTAAAYHMLTGGPRPSGASSAKQAIEQAYEEGLSDEMIEPTAITRGGAPLATIQDNDAVVFFNFRPDRARQLTRAFFDESFNGFARTRLKNLYLATFTPYDRKYPVPAAYTEQPLEFPLATILSQYQKKQLHLAETEKYAHITYYLNGGHESPFPGEDQILIPSSRTKNFADEPAMAAVEVTSRLLTELQKDTYDIIFANYANADMVGHTGDFAATTTACEVVDTCLARLHEFTEDNPEAVLIVTADHGNAEEMVHPETGAAETDHTSNPVPFHIINQKLRSQLPRSPQEIEHMYTNPIGVLSDIAPTILDLLQIPNSYPMSRVSLLSSLL